MRCNQSAHIAICRRFGAFLRAELGWLLGFPLERADCILIECRRCVPRWRGKRSHPDACWRVQSTLLDLRICTILITLQDILLITGSVLIFGNSIAPLQVFGENILHNHLASLTNTSV